MEGFECARAQQSVKVHPFGIRCQKHTVNNERNIHKIPYNPRRFMCGCPSFSSAPVFSSGFTVYTILWLRYFWSIWHLLWNCFLVTKNAWPMTSFSRSWLARNAFHGVPLPVNPGSHRHSIGWDGPTTPTFVFVFVYQPQAEAHLRLRHYFQSTPSGRMGWSGAGRKILPREGLY